MSVQDEPEPEGEPVGLGPHKQRINTPEEVYANTLRAMARIWKYVGNYGGYRGNIPGPNLDVELEVINKNREYWLRLLKGLDRRDFEVLIIEATLLNRLLLGFIRKSQALLKEEGEDSKRRGWKLEK